jgi:hypothetical protein
MHSRYHDTWYLYAYRLYQHLAYSIIAARHSMGNTILYKALTIQPHLLYISKGYPYNTLKFALQRPVLCFFSYPKATRLCYNSTSTSPRCCYVSQRPSYGSDHDILWQGLVPAFKIQASSTSSSTTTSGTRQDNTNTITKAAIPPTTTDSF